MPTEVTLIDKRTAAKSSATGTEMSIGNAPSVVHVGAHRAQLESLARQGGQLVVRLKTGEVLTINDFFVADGEVPNELVLDDDAGGFWHLDRASALDDPNFAHLSDLDPLLLAQSDSSGSWLSALGVGALMLGGAAAAGGGGGGGGSGSPQETTVSAQTDDAGTAVSGTTTPGAAVVIRDQLGNVLAQGTADGGGNFNLPLPTPLQPNQQVQVTATDGAGNSGSANVTYVDQLPPAAIDIAAVAAVDDVGAVQGALASGDTTDDAQPTFSGTGTPGDTITLYDGDVAVGTAVVDATGHWSLTPGTPLADGTHQLSFTATDPSGNESARSAAFELTVDTIAPALSLNPTDGITLSGTAEPGATVNIDTNGDGTPEGSVTADPVTGAWSFTPAAPLTDGTVVSVTATDAAGNTGPAATVTVDTSLDTTPPAAPVIDSVTDDVGSVLGALTSGATTDDTLPTLAGTAEAGATVSVYDGISLLGTVVADAVTGAWSFTPTTPLAEGPHSLAVAATDAAGNESAASAAFALTVDTTAPTAAPVIDSVSDDVGSVLGALASGASTDDTTPSLSGTAEVGATVSVYDGASLLGTVVADAVTGAWSFTPTVPLAEGPHSFTVTATDAAGNESAASAAFALTVDTTAPAAAPVIASVSDDAGALQGVLTSGDSTDDTTPTLAGTASLDSVSVSVYDGTTLLGTAPVVAGAWSFTPSPALAEGTYSLTVTATDAAGNESAASAAFALTVDTTAPAAAPVIDSVSDDVGSVLGALASGDSTDDTLPALTGTAELGATVSVYDGASLLGTVVADAVTGAWSFTPTVPLAEGPHSLTVTATDAAGNESLASAAFALTVDTTPPAAPLLDPTDGVTLGGTAEPGATVDIDTDGDGLPEGSVTADPVTGAWSFTPATPLGDGTVVAVTATDAAGNTGPAATVTVDATAPAAPVIDSVSDDVGSVLGALASGASTDDTTPSLSGTAEVGATVSVYDGASLLGTVVADAVTGAWSFTPTVPLAEGPHSFTVTATDAAGNESAASAAFALTVDTTAPTATIAITGLTDDTHTAGDWATDDTSPTISGTLSAALGSGEAVEISLDGGATWTTATVDGSTWFHGAGALAVGSYPINVRVVDAAGNVGSTGSQTIEITAVADAPIVQAQAGSFLGLDVEVLNLLDTGNQMFVAYDPEGDLQSVRVTYDPLVGINTGTLVWSTQLATELGVTVVADNDFFLGLTQRSELTITKTDGSAISNLEINELLKTVHMSSATNLLDGGLLPTFSISATDASGATLTDSSTSLLNLALLNVFGNPSGDPTVIEGTAGSDTRTGTGANEHLYGYGGADILSGAGGDDLLRGGAGADTLDGGDGDDLLVYDAADLSIDGGIGFDTLLIEDAGSITLNDATTNVHNIEAINLGIDTAANTVTLTELGVLNATSGGELVISGDSNDSVSMIDAEYQGQTLIGGHAYDRYLLGTTVTVLVEDPIPVVV